MAEGVDVDVVVPVKLLSRAKTRLIGAADGGRGDQDAHRALVLAILEDTVRAALAAQGLRRVLVVTADPRVAMLAQEWGADVLQGEPPGGLNVCLEHAARLLRRRDPHAVVGVLQGDLPALRPIELSAGVEAAAGRRSFCADREGSGTTLLLSAPGGDLDPRFGPGSARAHVQTGAVSLHGPWPSLRHDVDSPADLAVASGLGLGACTARLLMQRATSPH